MDIMVPTFKGGFKTNFYQNSCTSKHLYLEKYIKVTTSALTQEGIFHLSEERNRSRNSAHRFQEEGMLMNKTGKCLKESKEYSPYIGKYIVIKYLLYDLTFGIEPPKGLYHCWKKNTPV